MADQDYQIKITTTGDTAAVEALGKSLDKATAATKAHGQESEKAADLLGQLGQRGGESRHIIEGLEMASRGGTAGIMGMAKAMFYAREAFSISALTIFGGVLLGLLPTLMEWGKKLFGTGEEAKEMGDKFSGAAEAARRLGEVKLAALKTELEGIAGEKAGLDAMLTVFDALEQRLAKSRTAVALAEIDANPALSAEQKKAAKFAVEDQAAKGDEKRESDLRQERLASAKKAAEELAAVAAKAEADRDRKAGFIGADQAAADQAAEEIRQRRERQAQLSQDTQAHGGGPSGNALRLKNNAEARRLQGEINDITENAKALTPEMQGYQSGMLASLTEAANKAGEAAKKAREEYEKLAQIDSAHSSVDPISSGLESKARRIAAGVPAPADRGGSYSDVINQPSGMINGHAVDLSHVSSSISFTQRDGSIKQLAGAVGKLADGVKSRIEIDGRELLLVKEKVDDLANQLKATRR